MTQRTEHDRLLQDADDALFQIRMLAASEDIDRASEIMKDGIQLLSDASAYDRLNEDDDSCFILGYVLDKVMLMADNLKGLPSDNRSATAEDARAYRKEMERLEG